MRDLPDGWNDARVDEACDAVTVGIVVKPASLYRADGVRCFRSQNVRRDGIDDRGWVYISAEAHRRHAKSALRTGDVVVVRSGEPGVACVVPDRYAGSNCIDLVIARPNPAQIDPHYLAAYLNSPVAERAIARSQGGLAQKHLNVTAVQRLTLRLPPIVEQRAIVRALRLWDYAIGHLTHLIKLKARLRRGLMQQFLTGRRRFPEFADRDWRHVRLRDVAEPVSIRNRQTLGRDSVKAVTKATGMIPMRPELIAGSIDRYQLVQRDWFAYNPMRLNIGSIARWRDDRPALVSPDYVVFRCKDGELDPDYLDQFRRSHAWSSFMTACGNGSVRVRIWFEDLGAMRLQLPPLAEQRRIAAVLATADREIELLEQLLTALREQKKGLMQKLLTGQVRVTTDRGGNGNGDV